MVYLNSVFHERFHRLEGREAAPGSHCDDVAVGRSLENNTVDLLRFQQLDELLDTLTS